MDDDIIIFYQLQMSKETCPLFSEMVTSYSVNQPTVLGGYRNIKPDKLLEARPPIRDLKLLIFNIVI